MIIGDFGERWYKVATTLGLVVERMEFEPGQAAAPTRIAEWLNRDSAKAIKAVLFQHNETSTGVTNDVAAIARVVREHGALVMVDSVSGLGAPQDEQRLLVKHLPLGEVLGSFLAQAFVGSYDQIEVIYSGELATKQPTRRVQYQHRRHAPGAGVGPRGRRSWSCRSTNRWEPRRWSSSAH